MTVKSPADLLALANNTARGNLRSAADAIRSLAVGEPYQIFAGNPNGNLTPAAVSQRAWDSTNSVMYTATGLTNTSWVAVAKGGANSVGAGATLTLTAAAHARRTILLDTAAGSTVTLPAATGTGDIYKAVVSVLATSNNHIVKVANSSDAMQGIVFSMDDTSANAVAFAAVAGTDDTVTLNRTTTGSVTKGEWLEFEDIATNKWQVRGFISDTGTPATPFSATV